MKSRIKEFKDPTVPIIINGREHKIKFSLNVMADIQEAYGDLEKMGVVLDEKNNPAFLKDLRKILFFFLNDCLASDEEPYTEREVGRMLEIGNLAEVTQGIMKAMSIGVEGNGALTELENQYEEADENKNEKNVKSGQGE